METHLAVQARISGLVLCLKATSLQQTRVCPQTFIRTGTPVTGHFKGRAEKGLFVAYQHLAEQPPYAASFVK